MADAYLIEIGQTKLRVNFTAADGHEWTPVELRAWLIEQGFVPVKEGWIAEEDSLAALAKGEYRVIRQVV